jgi:hypothetical protein
LANKSLLVGSIFPRKNLCSCSCALVKRRAIGQKNLGNPPGKNLPTRAKIKFARHQK